MADSFDARALAWCGCLFAACSVGVDVDGITSAGFQVSAVESSATASDDGASSSSGSTDTGSSSEASGEDDGAAPQPPAPPSDSTSTSDADPAEIEDGCALLCASLAGCGLGATEPPPPQGCEAWCREPWDNGPCDAAWVELAACLATEPCVALDGFVDVGTIPAACGEIYDAYVAACLP
jgi:hypothetical protein